MRTRPRLNNGGTMAHDSGTPSLNRLSAPLVRSLIDDAASLRLAVGRTEGAAIIDAGIASRGGLEAGRRIAEICMGGLGRGELSAGGPFDRWPWMINVHSAQPVLACLGSQLAGWRLSAGEGEGACYALGSGPGRALAAKEPLFEELGYRDSA